MRRTFIAIFLFLPLFILGQEEDFNLLVADALENGESGQILKYELQIQRLQFSKKKADYIPFLKLSADASQSKNISYSFYEYVIGGLPQNKETIGTLKARSPSAELALVKKFMLGPKLELYTSFNEAWAESFVTNRGTAQTTNLDDNPSYASTSDVYNFDYGLRFNWNLLGKEAAKDYTMKGTMALDFQKSMFEVQRQADDFVVKVIGAYYQYSSAKLKEESARELLVFAQTACRDQEDQYKFGDLSDLEMEEAKIELGRAENKFEQDLLKLQDEHDSIERMVGHIPSSVENFENIYAWSSQQEAVPDYSKADFENTNVDIALARTDQILAKIDITKNRIGNQEVNLKAETFKQGNKPASPPGAPDQRNAWLVEVSYDTDLNFYQKRLAAKIERIKYQKAQITLEEVRKNVAQSLTKRYHELASLSKQLQINSRMLATFQSKIETEEALFQVGKSRRSDLMRVHRRYSEKKQEIINGYYQYRSSELAIKKDLGMLSELFLGSLEIPASA